MCGICGYLTTDKRPERSLLERMNATLLHRGPDDEGFYLENNLGLAMRRLSIIDISGGRQPLFNETHRIAAVYNGEIYNFRALRVELEQKGHQFSTSTDGEVIVHGYEEWGDDALEHLNGMFALALWDGPERRLLIARDRMGEKPLYWHWSQQGLLFASEAKAILVAPWVERRVNGLALHHYLTLQYCPNPLTIFQGIHQLQAGHKIVVRDGSEPETGKWWHLSYIPKLKLTDHDAIAETQRLFTHSVRSRLVSDVPLGVFLSGGIDSSIIVALMSESGIGPVKTFSIGFDEPQYSETGFARQIARRYGTDHHEFVFRSGNLVQTIENTIVAADEPFADPAALPLYDLARFAREHVTVALSGDGGDETAAGYRRYVLDGMLRFYSLFPDWITQHALPSFFSRLPEPAWIPEDRNPITGLKRLANFAGVSPKASLVRWGSYFTHDQKLALYTARWREELSATDTADFVGKYFDAAIADNLLDSTLHTDIVTYLAGDLLPKTDRMSMAHSLEVRAPFLDPDWVQWTARLQKHFKVRGMETKWLLKSSFGDKLPREIVNRGKHGFGVPIGLWLKDPLHEWIRERLLANPALEEWFEASAIECLLDEHDNGRVNHGKRLWALLAFAIWQERYLQGH